MSANVAYGEVKLEPRGGGGEVYEDPNNLHVSTGRGNYKVSCAYESSTLN